MFVINEKNSANVYAVNLYALGVPITVTIDDYLPTSSNGKTVFA